MLTTLTAIRADVRSLIDETTEGFWLDTEIDRWIQEGNTMFSTLTKCLCKRYEYTITTGDIKNDCELRLNSDFITFDEGIVWLNDKLLTETSTTYLDEYAGTKWRSHTGTPKQFFRRSDYLGFYPPASVGDVVVYFAIERAETISDSVAPLAGDYRIVGFRRYVRDYAIAQCWYKKGNDGKYREKMAEFDRGVGLVNKTIHGEKNQPKMMIPARQRTSRRTITSLNM